DGNRGHGDVLVEKIIGQRFVDGKGDVDRFVAVDEHVIDGGEGDGLRDVPVELWEGELGAAGDSEAIGVERCHVNDDVMAGERIEDDLDLEGVAFGDLCGCVRRGGDTGGIDVEDDVVDVKLCAENRCGSGGANPAPADVQGLE